jgi:hypothetical protein
MAPLQRSSISSRHPERAADSDVETAAASAEEIGKG